MVVKEEQENEENEEEEEEEKDEEDTSSLPATLLNPIAFTIDFFSKANKASCMRIWSTRESVSI